MRISPGRGDLHDNTIHSCTPGTHLIPERELLSLDLHQVILRTCKGSLSAFSLELEIQSRIDVDGMDGKRIGYRRARYRITTLGTSKHDTPISLGTSKMGIRVSISLSVNE
jgi:hypothetical protein